MLANYRTVHPRSSERRGLNSGDSCSDEPKIRISEDGNLGRQNDYFTFKLEKMCHIMWRMFERETRKDDFQHKPIK